MKILQDYIVPVVRLLRQDGQFHYARLHGTAFFINPQGSFLTAKHVIDDALADQDEHGGEIALVMRKRDDPERRYVGHIHGYSFADPPYDIAIGSVKHSSKSCFAASDSTRVWGWDDVHTAGYAASAESRQGSEVTVDIRSLKGYVVRKVPPSISAYPSGANPSVFELNFPIPEGMSGSPLVLRYGADDDVPKGAPFPLLGVCTGTAEIAVGTGSRELYGVAHDLRELTEWAPEGFGNKTLGELIRPEEAHEQEKGTGNKFV